MKSFFCAVLLTLYCSSAHAQTALETFLYLTHQASADQYDKISETPGGYISSPALHWEHVNNSGAVDTTVDITQKDECHYTVKSKDLFGTNELSYDFSEFSKANLGRRVQQGGPFGQTIWVIFHGAKFCVTSSSRGEYNGTKVGSCEEFEAAPMYPERYGAAFDLFTSKYCKGRAF